MVSITGGKRGLVVGRWICNPEVSGSNPTPCHWMDLSSVAPNSYSPRCVNSQLVRLPPVGILNLLCLICIVFVCYAHLNIFTWNLRDINVYYYYFVIIKLKHYASKATVISVYYSLIYPYVTYACTLWGNNYNAPLPQIVKFQNKAVRRYK